MSQKLISQIIEKTCEGCGKTKQYELATPTPEVLRELSDWYSHIREVWAGNGFVKLMSQSCSPACAPAAIAKLATPEPEQELDNIDLASLRNPGMVQ